MEAYPPYSLTPKESRDLNDNFEQHVEQMDVSDETLIAYVGTFLQTYRVTIQEFFPHVQDILPLCDTSLQSMILRFNQNGVFIGHRRSQSSKIEIQYVNDLDPPLKSLNVFEIAERFQPLSLWFSFEVRSYDQDEAQQDGIRRALTDVLDYFWQKVKTEDFHRLCLDLLAAEDISVELETRYNNGSSRLDAVGTVILNEPAGFRRAEAWAFEFKLHTRDRVSVEALHQVERYLNELEPEIDIVCLVTSGDLTSVGKHVSVSNPRIRVWDRHILNWLVHEHLEVIKPYFVDYANAVSELSGTKQANEKSSRLNEFQSKLDACPPGQADFAKYQKIGQELWEHLFFPNIAKGRYEERTKDGVQRRDVLFRNQRGTRFWERVADRFAADIIIVDFKNYSAPIGSQVISDVEKYASPQLGRFIVVVSRLGADSTAEPAQLRILKDSHRNTCILVVSDAQMLEMIKRKEQEQEPADVLEDLLDDLLIKA